MGSSELTAGGNPAMDLSIPSRGGGGRGVRVRVRVRVR